MEVNEHGQVRALDRVWAASEIGLLLGAAIVAAVTARTMVSAPTISTALAGKALRKRKTSGVTIALSAGCLNEPSSVTYRGLVDCAWTTAAEADAGEHE